MKKLVTVWFENPLNGMPFVVQFFHRTGQGAVRDRVRATRKVTAGKCKGYSVEKWHNFARILGCLSGKKRNLVRSS